MTGLLVGTLPLAAMGAEASELVGFEVDRRPASDLGVARPEGIAYDSEAGEFLVASTEGTRVVVGRLNELWERVGRARLPRGTNPSTLVYDAASNTLRSIDEDSITSMGSPAAGGRPGRPEDVPLQEGELEEPSSATFDPVSESILVLDPDGVVSVDEKGAISEPASLPEVEKSDLVAFNSEDGLLYVLDVEAERLDAYDAAGAVTSSYDMSNPVLESPQAMTFAPSTDSTDDPETLNLFIADSGGESSEGAVTEVLLVEAQAITAAAIETAELVNVIDTSGWSPPSTDPSGMAWNLSRQELIVVDSEVNETNLFQNVNLWQVTRLGQVVRTGATDGPLSAGNYSDEPTGVGYDNDSGTMFVSDDTGTRSVYVVKPGSDNELGTSDDVVSQINAGAFGATDTEDPEFDRNSGDLFFVSGTNQEVYRIDPGGDGQFATTDDSVSQFDISHLPSGDFEGLTSSQSRDTLFLGSRNTDQIWEITKDGSTVIREIQVDVGQSFISSLALAPSSDDPSQFSLYFSDRGADEVNDGTIYEIRVPNLDEPVGNLAPSVDAGPDQTVALGETADLDGVVNDDGLPADGTLTSTWSELSGPGDVTFGDAASPSTTADFSAAGVYELQLHATDGEREGSDTVLVTVEAPPNQPPTIDPIEDVTVAEGQTATVPVSASDPDGDDLFFTFDALPAFGNFDEPTREVSFSPQLGDAGEYGPITVSVFDGAPGTVQAPLFRAAASAADTGSSGSVLTISKPVGTEEGDFLLAQIRYRGGTPNLTAPAGWVELATIPDGSNGNHTILYKFAGPTEPNSYEFNQNLAQGRMSGGIGAYIGVDPDNPIDAWAASAADLATLQAPSVQTTAEQTRVVRLWGWRGSQESVVGTNVPPAGIAERWSEQSGHNNDDRNRVLAGDNVQGDPGPTGTATASGSTPTTTNRERDRSAFTVALSPAPVAASASTSFNVTVTEAPVNQAPLATDDQADTAQDTPVTVDVLSNDSDADSDPLSVDNVSDPANGSAVIESDDTVTYTPDPGFSGVDTFTYQASDGTDLSNQATVTITVAAAPSDSRQRAVYGPVDWDGDGLTELGFYRPATGRWYPEDQASRFFSIVGEESEIQLLVGDYSDDGVDLPQLAFYRPSNGRWYTEGAGSRYYSWVGEEQEVVPVPGDWDGDGNWELGFYRPSNGRWYREGHFSKYFSWVGEESEIVLLPGNWDDTDPEWDLAFYRPADGRWYVDGQPSRYFSIAGEESEIVLKPADWDGDGVLEMAFYRPSNGRWYIEGQGSRYYSWTGEESEIVPVAAYWTPDNDGAVPVVDLGFYRPANGRWYREGHFSKYFSWLGEETEIVIQPNDYQ